MLVVVVNFSGQPKTTEISGSFHYLVATEKPLKSLVANAEIIIFFIGSLWTATKTEKPLLSDRLLIVSELWSKVLVD